MNHWSVSDHLPTKTFYFGVARLANVTCPDLDIAPLFVQGDNSRKLVAAIMEGHQQKTTPLARELTRIFNSYNKNSIQLKKNLKETNIFFREIRQNYSNACASAVSLDATALEAGKFEHLLP